MQDEHASPGAIDSHQHFWDIDRLAYPWMPKGDSVLRRNYLPADLAPRLEPAGVERTVVVQAQMTDAESEFLFELADAAISIAGVVAWVDLASADVGRDLDRLQRNPKFVGVRHQVHDELDDRWLLRPDVVRGLRELARRGLTYDLLLRPRHLRPAMSLAEAVPDLRMVVDHIAKPEIASGLMEPWATELAALAEVPGVYCKLSGMATEANADAWELEIVPYARHAAERFGFDRLMWGSDWPVCLLADDYAAIREGALAALGPLADGDRRKLTRSTAAAFYGLGDR